MKYKKTLFIAALLGMQLMASLIKAIGVTQIQYYDGLNDGIKAGKVKSVTGSSPGIKVSVTQSEYGSNL